MSDLKHIYDNADEDKRSEIFEVIESSVNSGAPVAVLREKIKEFIQENQKTAA